MPVKVPRGPGRADDPVVDQVAAALERYLTDHPRAVIDIYRQGRYSVKVRVVDPDFDGVRRAARHDRVWAYLGTLPEDVYGEVHVLLPLAPAEQPESAGNFEFDHPVKWDGELGLSINGEGKSLFGVPTAGGISIVGAEPTVPATGTPPTSS